MRLIRSVRQRRLMNLTPLIDVVFLLLVFFMLASTFLKFGTVKLEAASSGPGPTAHLARVALIHVAAGGAFLVDGKPVGRDGLAAAARAAMARGKRDAVVVLRRDATAGDLVAGLSILRGRGFQSLRVVE